MAFQDRQIEEALKGQRDQLSRTSIADLFAKDQGRFDRFSVRFDDLLFDYSKNLITQETMGLLISLAESAQLRRWIERFFGGEKINQTEHRSVLHVALRNMGGEAQYADGRDVMPEVRGVREKMRRFADAISSGSFRGYRGDKIEDVVNIGIGGSNLGPKMAAEALRPYWRKGLRIHFVSNVDGSHIKETISNLDAKKTLFLVASKTFTTQETITNAITAREWIVEQLGDQRAVASHFAALSTAEEEVRRFGIAKENMFEFWDWVGGRFSVWSAIGLSLAIAIGMDRFEEFLSGASEIDAHFRREPFQRNIPVLMALLGIWYGNFLGAETHAVIPYDQYLRFFPEFIQQGDMESNGKSASRDGKRIASYQTGPIIWGAAGTDGQHAFFQLLHQGTHLVPCDFIAAARSHSEIRDHHPKLLANFFAQTEALMQGTKVLGDALGNAADDHEGGLEIHRFCPGNRPSNTFLFPIFDPRNLGRLIALYEHKIFTQGIIWNVFSFDQWGVQLGKILADGILRHLQSEEEGPIERDCSTVGLIAHYKSLRRRGT